MTEVSGMVELLRSIAERLQNSADGLSKDFLLEVADKVEALEIAAKTAGHLVWYVPKKAKDSSMSLIPRVVAEELMTALNKAGHYGKDGDLVEMRRN